MCYFKEFSQRPSWTDSNSFTTFSFGCLQSINFLFQHLIFTFFFFDNETILDRGTCRLNFSIKHSLTGLLYEHLSGTRADLRLCIVEYIYPLIYKEKNGQVEQPIFPELPWTPTEGLIVKIRECF